MNRKRVLIVEDSAVVREQLRRLIAADPRLEVAAAVESAEEALRILDRVSPDVISLDICLPGMQGFEATRRIMAQRPTPIVIVSASLAGDEVRLTMEALKCGALAAVEKPVAAGHPEHAEMARRLCTQLSIMSEVRVVRQRMLVTPAPVPAVRPHLARCRFGVLGLAASTGGPNALLEVLRGLGADFPIPVVIVQHMTPAFVSGFGRWLSDAGNLPVEVVASRTQMVPGRVYLAPADRHVVVDRVCVGLDGSAPVGPHRPSADVLFRSMARNLGQAGLGVLLTGMGEDGAGGLLELWRAGGYTIAEDESTAVVYGMPGTAARLGAVRESLPLPGIAPRLRELVREADGGI